MDDDKIVYRWQLYSKLTEGSTGKRIVMSGLMWHGHTLHCYVLFKVIIYYLIKQTNNKIPYSVLLVNMVIVFSGIYWKQLLNADIECMYSRDSRIDSSYNGSPR